MAYNPPSKCMLRVDFSRQADEPNWSEDNMKKVKEKKIFTKQGGELKPVNRLPPGEEPIGKVKGEISGGSQKEHHLSKEMEEALPWVMEGLPDQMMQR